MDERLVITISEIILYSTGCPKCSVLEKKLDESGVPYEVVDDVEVMAQLGIMTIPVLSVDGEMKEFMDAIKWVQEKQ